MGFKRSKKKPVRFSATYDDPLWDKEGIDPNNESITALLNVIELGQYSVGMVCDVYELCTHLVCKKSYELWAAIDSTKRHLVLDDCSEHEWIDMSNELVSGGEYCKNCGWLKESE